MGALDATAFDFWIGDWDGVFDGGHARNVISREFAGAVLVERFAMAAPETWSGLSLSVFDASLDLWRETWVDDAGNYWAFVGSLVDGDSRSGRPSPSMSTRSGSEWSSRTSRPTPSTGVGRSRPTASHGP